MQRLGAVLGLRSSSTYSTYRVLIGECYCVLNLYHEYILDVRTFSTANYTYYIQFACCASISVYVAGRSHDRSALMFDTLMNSLATRISDFRIRTHKCMRGTIVCMSVVMLGVEVDVWPWFWRFQ